jgi:hypothetical protein
MTDITLVPITGAANLSAINNNFAKVQESVNNDVLNLAGGNNTMNQDIDMNGNDLLNLNTDVDNPSGLITLGQADARYYNVSGDTLTGPMNAAGQHVTNLPVPSVGTEPMRKAEFDAQVVAQDVRDDSQDALAATTKSQAVRAPDGEAIPALPIAAGRADKLMSFDPFGNPVAIAAANQSATDLELRLADPTDPLKGVGMVGRATRQIKTVAELRTVPGRYDQDRIDLVSVLGGWESNVLYPFPSGKGSFVWSSTSVATDDTGVVVAVTGVTTGRWIREFDGSVNVTWFGAIPDGLTHCSAAFQLAVDNYASVYIPPGKFVLNNYTTHPLIYTTGLVDCGIKITSAQKCVELYGAGESTLLLSEPGVRYNSLISIYNVTDRLIHSFNMDGLYDRSGSAFLAGIIGIRAQSILRCTMHSLKITNFTYHCLAMYGGSNAVTEPACSWCKCHDLYLDGGGQTSLLVYSSTFTGLVLPNEFIEFTNIFAMNSHVYFGVEVRKSKNITFANLIANGNTKGGVNLEEGAINCKFVNTVGKFNGAYGLHMTGNGLENVTGNSFVDFDFSENTAHNVLAFQGAVGNYFIRGNFNSAVNGNGWRSEDTSSFGNYFRQVECKDNPDEGLLFQNYEYLDDVTITGNGLRGVTVFGASRHRNVVSRNNGTNITTVVGKIHDISDCDFGPKHAIYTKDCIKAGQFIEVNRAGRYANGGTDITEETDATSISTLVWKTSVHFGALIAIPTGVFTGSKFTHLEVIFRVKTDGPSRLLRDINGATNITIPTNTDWIPVSYLIPIAGLTASSVLNIRYETSGGYVMMDGYQLALHDSRDISISITPASVAAATAVEQTFTATGVLVGDAISVSPPSITAGVAPMCARVTATDTVAITFMNATAGALVPAAGAYRLQFTRA